MEHCGYIHLNENIKHLEELKIFVFYLAASLGILAHFNARLEIRCLALQVVRSNEYFLPHKNTE